MRCVGRLSLAVASLGALALLIGIGAPQPALGAQWYAAPALQLQSGYDQNPRFLISNPVSTEVFDLMPSLELGARAARWGGRVIGAVHLRRYPGLSELNRNDNSVNVFSHYDTQRLSWQLDGSYAQRSLLGETRPQGVQTGLVQFQSQVATGTASPSLTWQITPTDLLQFAYTFQNTSYQDAALLGLSNFRYQSGAVTYQHDFSPRLQVFGTPSYSMFEVPASGFQSRTAGLQLGITRLFSPTLSATVAVGGRRTQAQGVQTVPLGYIIYFGQLIPIGFKSVDVTSLSTGITVNASVTKRLERGSLSASFTRALSPSGLGGEVETNVLKLDLKRPFTPRLAGFVSLHLLRARSVGTSVSTAGDHDWARFSPGLRWRWTRRASVALTYAFSWTRNSASGQIAHDNVIYLTLSYRWPRIALSY